MADLILHNIHPFTGNINEGTFILIQNTRQIPPHISLVNDGKYFSTSVAGVKTGMDAESVLKNIGSKKIPSLILQITPLRFSTDALTEVFNTYGVLDKPEKSCLFPIIAVLNQSYGLIHESEFVFELIKELEKNGNLKRISQCNMEDILEKESYLFPIYSRTDIRNCIDKLNEKERV